MHELFADIGIGDILGLIAMVGFCWVYFRGSADKATIESQDRLISSRGRETEDLTRRLGSAEARVTALESENAVLRNAVSHVEELVQLQDSLQQLRESSDSNHSESIAALGQILVALERLAA